MSNVRVLLIGGALLIATSIASLANTCDIVIISDVGSIESYTHTGYPKSLAEEAAKLVDVKDYVGYNVKDFTVKAYGEYAEPSFTELLAPVKWVTNIGGRDPPTLKGNYLLTIKIEKAFYTNRNNFKRPRDGLTSS